MASTVGLFQRQRLGKRLADRVEHIWTSRVPRYHLELNISIIMLLYLYHTLINALSAHIIHNNLNTIFYTDVEDSPTKTIYIRHMETHTHG